MSATGSQVRLLRGQKLTAVIRGTVACKRVDIAVTFLSDGVVARLSLPYDLSRFRIAYDASSRLCSPAALADLLSRGAHVFDVPDLHANMFCSGTHVVHCSGFSLAIGTSDGRAPGHQIGVWSSDRVEIDRAGAWFNAICEVSK